MLAIGSVISSVALTRVRTNAIQTHAKSPARFTGTIVDAVVAQGSCEVGAGAIALEALTDAPALPVLARLRVTVVVGHASLAVPIETRVALTRVSAQGIAAGRIDVARSIQAFVDVRA
jgi:hypothetical protein